MRQSLGWIAFALFLSSMLLPSFWPSAWANVGTTNNTVNDASQTPPPAAVEPEDDDHGEDETEIGKAKRPVTRELVREELLLDVSGIRDHAHLRFLKDKIRLALPENTVLYERRISRGRVVFAVKTKMDMGELKQLVGGLASPEMGGFSVLDAKGNQLQVKVQ